jgi:Na+-transporting methylmalonyl-CoA/oxaloacetate decarboxylase gamma subunit
LAFTLTGIVFVVLYSLIFVTQPMQQSPNDAKFFELITPIATFLTGILSGIMLGKSEKQDMPEAPKAPEPLEITPADLVPEPPTELAPLVVAAAVGAAGATAVAAADDDEEDHIA